MNDIDLEAFHQRMEAEEVAKRQALLDEIKQARDRIANKDKAIEELKFERELIFGNFLSIINQKLRYSSFNIFMGFTDDLFWKAWRWNQHKDIVDEELKKGELTKDDYKQHKTCFDMTVRTVQEKFFGELKDKVKFKEIIKNWTTGYDYIFKYKNQEIQVYVPLFSADKDSWEYALSGYRVNYKESDYCSGYICSSLDIKEVAKKLQEWLLAEGWKKDGK